MEKLLKVSYALLALALFVLVVYVLTLFRAGRNEIPFRPGVVRLDKETLQTKFEFVKEKYDSQEVQKYADPDFDDSQWSEVSIPLFQFNDQPGYKDAIKEGKSGVFRLRIKLPDHLKDKEQIAFYPNHISTRNFSIFINGRNERAMRKTSVLDENSQIFVLNKNDFVDSGQVFVSIITSVSVNELGLDTKRPMLLGNLSEISGMPVAIDRSGVSYPLLFMFLKLGVLIVFILLRLSGFKSDFIDYFLVYGSSVVLEGIGYTQLFLRFSDMTVVGIWYLTQTAALAALSLMVLRMAPNKPKVLPFAFGTAVIWLLNMSLAYGWLGVREISVFITYDFNKYLFSVCLGISLAFAIFRSFKFKYSMSNRVLLAGITVYWLATTMEYSLNQYLAQNFRSYLDLAVFYIMASIIFKTFMDDKERLRAQDLEIAEIKQKVKVADMIRQVNHDIKSPLTVLGLVADNSDELPEKKRQMLIAAISRIKAISSDLENKKEIKKSAHDFRSTHICSLISPIIDEKREEYKDRLINISVHYSLSSYDAFVNLDPVDLGRILSNIINNSIEAASEVPKIKIEIDKIENKVSILIADNGKGFPLGDKSAFFEKGYSVGKTNGQGLGLFHASEFLKNNGGRIEILENQNGARIKIEIPTSKVPIWFQAQLNLIDSSRIVIVDDDPTVHQLWKGRFDSLKTKYETIHHSDPKKFLDWKKENATVHDLYIVDYEFRGSDLCGIDLIKQIKDKNQVLLCTGRYEETEIDNFASKNKISMVPKPMISQLPISEGEK